MADLKSETGTLASIALKYKPSAELHTPTVHFDGLPVREPTALRVYQSVLFLCVVNRCE